MRTPLSRPCAALIFALALSATTPSACPAATARHSASPLLLADSRTKDTGWNLWTYLGGLNNRTRIVQFCAVVMCLALFILLRKLTPDRIACGPVEPSTPAPPPSDTNPEP